MYYFIVNPASRSNHGIMVWNEIEQYLMSENVEFKVYFSKNAGHVYRLVYDICSEHVDDETRTNLIILGGDGTFNEALQGVISFEKVNIGYIPTGSSNDFARALSYPVSPVECLKRILACEEPGKLDLGRLRYKEISEERTSLASEPVSHTRFFVVSCGIGFDAAVCEEALDSNIKNVLNKIRLGKLAYGLIAIKQIFRSKLCDASLTIDDDERIEIKNARFVVGMNTCFEGGGYKFAPDAIPDDGHLDICTVGNISPLGVLRALPGAPKGKHIKLKAVHIYRVKEFEVETGSPLWVHTDGEVYTKSNHIKVSILPGALNFLW